jgi:RNA polymerase sigma-70 factor, ECF subfamily
MSNHIRIDPCGQFDDAALVQIVQKEAIRSRSAFQCLVVRYQGWLYKLVLHLCGDRTLAEDLVQDAFVKAYLSIADFRSEASIKTWLRRIALHATFDQHRRKRRTPTASPAAEEPDSLLSSQRDGLIERDALAKAMQALPYPYREILLLRYVEELSVEEVSKQLDISVSAAKMRLLRAREQFEESYGRQTR